jgi:hypothetical protein
LAVSVSCQAKEAHNRARDFPDPVGDSSREFWLLWMLVMILDIMATWDL